MTRTALVLGGGGITGIAWELGILRGLADAGVDLTGADLVVGTSAGSVVGAQITGDLSLEELYARQLEPPHAEIGADLPRTLLLGLVPALLVPGSSQTKRARIGAKALQAHEPGGQRRVEVIRSRIATDHWPDRDLRVTAVDAESGEFVVFDRSSGVPIDLAVAASCAVPLVWPAVTIAGRHYVDGGVRSPANVDLAAGCDVVVVLAPLTHSLGRGTSVAAQLAGTGARRSVVVAPDKEARTAFGRNPLDPLKRADAARAGLRQSVAVLDGVRAAWTARTDG